MAEQPEIREEYSGNESVVVLQDNSGYFIWTAESPQALNRRINVPDFTPRQIARYDGITIEAANILNEEAGRLSRAKETSDFSNVLA